MSSQLQTNLNLIQTEINTKIIPANIKKDITVFGVTGTYEGIDTSDATAEAMYIADSKTAYTNGEKITGIATTYNFKSTRTATPINFEHDYRSNIDYPDTTMLSNITPMTQSGVAKWKFVTPAISTNAPKPMGPGESVFIEGGKFVLAVRESLLAQRFGVTADDIKTGETILGIDGAFSECIDKGISNVQYKSYWFDGPFVLQSNGYYKFDGANMGQSNLEITFNKTTARDVKLSYKGTNIHKEDTEDPGMYLSETNITVDNSTILTPPEDSSEYTDITIANMSVGEHTILIETYGDGDTALEIKLLDETPISATNISKGLTGFVNGNKIKGTYEPDIELDLSSVTYTGNGISTLLERLYMAGVSVIKINHPIDCSNYLPTNLSGVGSMEEYLILTNTSAVTSIPSNMFSGWTSVKRIPLFDTSGITDWSQSLEQMLTNINQTIEVIPAFDMSGQQNMQSFIYSGYTLRPLNNCSNLSYESINNLMASLLTLPQQPGQIPPTFCTLAKLGLDVGYSGNMFDASEIETLSNYPAFTAAGWSIV